MKDRKPKAVAAGHICLDITPVFHGGAEEIGKILLPGKIVDVGAADIHTGGSVANTGLAMGLLGTEMKLMGKVGTDALGQTLLACLKAYGTEGMKIDPSASTSYSVVLAVPGIDRIFLHHSGANDTFCAKDIDFDVVAKADLFHFGYPPIMRQMYLEEGTELAEIFRRVHEMGVVTSLDMASVDPNSEAAKQDWKRILENVLPYVDLFVPSIEEICFMIDRERYQSWMERAAGKEIPSILNVEKDIRPVAEQLRQLGAKSLLMKCGAPGLYYHMGGPEDIIALGSKLGRSMMDWAYRKGFQPSFRAKRVLSATGAGDTTIAAFLSAMLQGYDLDWCVRLAAATGALCVENYDALSGLKPLAELKKDIENGWEKRK
ncbi:carbohydrate kinase family protein [Anaerotignum lactatifermentans]|uniref:Carbohydrate kinase family protein n=1 Tax=Anaerotignum lactatifermentans TaxID=160404 RepID=A0ABS2G919_9FIRM|nr:carbohydrate kinase family protein [Anaerotignum lactatifermentans]MBM6828833.1 carbohydrate kinase family protein [Anaerotignum lactatifermentans]MBM6876994.1 carbohydrate kinase family protein [Anaerotignum lactatifermentans]MBM6950552.1 carbohydrate kinase family protein [Anaerotignum lactatifermentans]